MASLLRQINQYFPEIYRLVIDAARQAGTNAFLIGAGAIAMHYANNKQNPSRGTKDIDFAVLVGDPKQFEPIKSLLKEKGFNQSYEPFTLYHPGWKTTIDLMPFGTLEDKRIVRFLEKQSELVVIGFEQVAQNVLRLQIEEQEFRVSPLSGIVLLKTFAWLDRPELRGQDLEDILNICKGYFQLYTNEVYERHGSQLGNFDPNDPHLNTFIGAESIGTEIKKILFGSPTLVLVRLIKINDAKPKKRCNKSVGHNAWK